MWICLLLVPIIPNIVYVEIVFMTLSLISALGALVLIKHANTREY